MAEAGGGAGGNHQNGGPAGGAVGDEAVEAINLNTEEEVERLLSEKLVDGFLLLEKACPACVTPLVKRDAAWASPRSPTGYHPHQQQQPPGAAPGAGPSNFDSAKSYDNLTYGAGIDSVLYESPIQPIAGVPFCVSCQAHVVTNTEEVVVLESADHLKVRGTIMVAMSRETMDDGDDEESASTPWGPNKVSAGAAPPEEAARQDAPGATDRPSEEGAAVDQLLLSPQASAAPAIDSKGSKFSTKSILKSRSDHFSTTSGPSAAAATATASASLKAHGAHLLPMMLNDDEDEDISLQEIEVVHLDDHTTTSEMERRVEGDGPNTTAERIVMTRPSTDLTGPLDVHREEECTDVDTYHSSHYNNQQVERNPMRSLRVGGDSVANTSSVAVLRSDTSLPIYPTESRANTSVAALRGDVSFPAAFPQGGDSPTNTSLAVLRGDPSMPVVGPVASDQQTSRFSGEENLRTSPTPFLKSAMMERANSEATPHVNESVSVLATQGQGPQCGTAIAGHAVHVDRFRSLITHSDETPTPASGQQTARQSESIDTSPASFGPKPPPQNATGAQLPAPQVSKVGEAQSSQQSVPVEALISYDERRGIATRVLGKKMIQGYSLTEHKCVKCQMPLMEKERVFFCVVCPVLRQHYKKSTQLKAKELTVTLREREATEPSLSAQSHHSQSRKSLQLGDAHEHPSNRLTVQPATMPERAPHGSPAKATAKLPNLTIDTALSKASTIPSHNSPRALAESSIHNEQQSNNGSPPTAHQSPRSDVPSKSGRRSVNSVPRKVLSGEPLPQPPSVHRMTSTENHQSSAPSRSRSSRSKSRSRSRGKNVIPPVAATTQTSPSAKLLGIIETEVHQTPDRQEESHSSDLTSAAPNPPSTIVSGTLDDESAKMSSITESYVSTFTNGTSRRSIREQELKSRPSKPILPVVKSLRTPQVDQKLAEPVRAASSSSRKPKMPVTVETVHSESVGRSAAASKIQSVRTKSIQEGGACMEALEKYSSMVALPQLRDFLDDRNSAPAQDVERANENGLKLAVPSASFLDEQISVSHSRMSAIDSVIHKKTKRLQELKNARLAHEVAEAESTGMLAEFNRMLQDEIRKEEDSVRHEIEVAEQHLHEMEVTEHLHTAEEEKRRIMAKRSQEIEADRLVEAEKSRKDAEDAMEKSRQAIEIVTSLSGADKDAGFGSRPPEYAAADGAIELPMESDHTPSATSQAGASPRHIANLQSNFNSQRSLVTTEIGQRMMKGWNLIDASCPNCVMPLMTDQGNADEICVLCGVVGAIPSASADRSVKTWTKGARVHAGRTSTDSKQASLSRKSLTSVSNVATNTSASNRSGAADPAERKRLKRELLREIIAETSVYMSNKDTRDDSNSSRTSQVSAEQMERILVPLPEKASKKERLLQIVKGETKRATEKLSRHGHVRRNDTSTSKIDSPKKAASRRVEKLNKSPAEKTLPQKADPSAVHEASPVLSLHFRRRDESSSRADPPASVAGSIRTKTAVDADGASSWMEPMAALSSDAEEPTSPTGRSKDKNTWSDKTDLSPVVEVLSADETKDAPSASDVALTLDTNFQLAEEHRMVHPSPGMTEVLPPQTSSPAQSRFTTSSDSTNKATYRGVDNSERMTAPVPSPGISVAPAPELEHRSRHNIDTSGSAALLPASMRPATSPGIDTIERGTLHEDDESYARIRSSRSAPVRSHLIPLRRHLARKNKVAATKPIYHDASVASDVRWDRSTSRYGQHEDEASRDSSLEPSPHSYRGPHDPSDIRPQTSNMSTSSSSRPRITPESIMRPRSTRSTGSLESIDDGQYYPQHSESEDRKLRLANKLPSESTSASIGTSKAVVSGLGSPHLMNVSRPPVHHHIVVQEAASFSSSTRRALLVQGELEEDLDPAPSPLAVIVPAPASSPVENDDVEQDRVLISREVIVVDDGNNGPLDLSRWEQEVEVGKEEDGADSEDGGGGPGRGGRGGSVGSATLDAVLARIEETKRQLQSAPSVSEDGSVTIRDPSRSHEPPHKLRELIDNLAAAAEEIEKQDRLDMRLCY